MRTRSQTRNRSRQQSQPAVVQPFHLEEPFVNPPLVSMADNRTMAQLLQAPTEGYEDAIVIPEINANFELKHGLINLVQNKQFFGHDKEDPHAHIRYFNKITSTMRFPDIPSTSIKLMLFPFSLEDTFYNALNDNDQDSLNSAAGGNFLDKMPRECLKIIESKSKYVSQATAANFNQGNTNSRPSMAANQIRPPGFPPIQNNQNHFNQNQGNNFNQNRGTNFNQNRGNNFYQGQVYQPPTSQPPVYQAQPYQAPAQQMQGSLPSNTVTYPKEDLKGITTRSGVAYQGPTIPTTSSPKVVERRTEVTKDTIFPTNNGITEDVQPPVVPVENQNLVSEPVVVPVSAPMPNQKPSIPYPSRRNDEKRRENADEQKKEKC
ncbi:hypothetical protein Tco_0593187 [Tanacetum coccineum]